MIAPAKIRMNNLAFKAITPTQRPKAIASKSCFGSFSETNLSKIDLQHKARMSQKS